MTAPQSLVVRTFTDRAEGLSHFVLRAGEAPRLLAFDDALGCPVETALAALEWTGAVGILLDDDLLHAARPGDDLPLRGGRTGVLTSGLRDKCVDSHLHIVWTEMGRMSGRRGLGIHITSRREGVTRIKSGTCEILAGAYFSLTRLVGYVL